mmetsp:Transcript_30731/g.98269  ORF Transcript_30731/g.98269 Transcript_30731/m.98269 type:complete len:163 (+) Transcript_30731:79-567(+)
MALGVFTADRAGKIAVITDGKTCEAARHVTALCSAPILAGTGTWSVTLRVDHQLGSGAYLDIGMVDAKGVDLNEGASWEDWAVTMVCNGTLTAKGVDTEGKGFTDGDEITISFDSNAKLLRFLRGSEELNRYEFQSYESHGWCFAVSSGGQATIIASQAGTS